MDDWTQCRETVARVEALFSRPKAVVAQTSQRGVDLEEQVARKVHCEKSSSLSQRDSVSPTRRTREKSVHAEDAPTGPILWEREGPVPSLSLSWVSCPLHALRWKEPLAHQGMGSL